MTTQEALATLTTFGHDAQATGTVPIGPYAVALAILVAGSLDALRSGKLAPDDPVEVEDIGMAVDLALVRMRIALENSPF